MRLLEFQGKELFRKEGIPVPESRYVRVTNMPSNTFPNAAADAVSSAAEECLASPQCSRVVVKAQVDMGGRGKAGLIKTAGSAEEAASAAAEILRTPYTVPALLVEQAIPIQQELYLSVSTDARRAQFVILASAQGGVDIEELATSNPSAVKHIYVDPYYGLQNYQSRAAAYNIELEADTAKQFARLVRQLYHIFHTCDAELAEINPVFLTTDGRLLAGDAKLIIDDNSLARQRNFQRSREQYESDAAYEAAQEGIPYVQFDGDISLMCAGAGLTTTVFDLINFEGGTVANYLEFGGANYHKAQRAMELCLKNKSSVILVVTFGTIARADVMAKGVTNAIQTLKPDRPIVTCIRGTNEQEAEGILRNAGLTPLFDTEEAVRTAIHLAKTRRHST